MEATILSERGVFAHQVCDQGLAKELRRTNSAYQQRQFDSANEDIKQPEREKVLDFILDHHRLDRLRLLSLPGVYWPFERMLLKAWPRAASFVGLEHNWGVIEVGTPWMPGVRPVYAEHELGIGTMKMMQTDIARWVHVEAPTFFSLGRTDRKRQGLGNRRTTMSFRTKFKEATAAWLDLMTNCGRQLLELLPKVGSVFDRFTRSCPLAVTFMIGREGDIELDGDPLGKRVRMISAALNRSKFRRFEIVDAWQYRSVGSVTMGTITGKCISRV